MPEHEFKANCHQCDWYGTFSMPFKDVFAAIKEMHRLHVAHWKELLQSGEAMIYCPGTHFRLECPEEVFKVGPGGSLVKIGAAKAGPLPPLDSLRQDIFPLLDFLKHAAERYREKSECSIEVTGTARKCHVLRGELVGIDTHTWDCDYSVERIKGGWRVVLKGMLTHNDARGMMYSRREDIDCNIEFTDQEARDPEKILSRLYI